MFENSDLEILQSYEGRHCVLALAKEQASGRVWIVKGVFQSGRLAMVDKRPLDVDTAEVLRFQKFLSTISMVVRAGRGKQTKIFIAVTDDSPEPGIYF